jgi:hypothetical protein
VAALTREGWQRPEPPGPPVLDTGELAALTAEDHDDPGAPLGVIDNP